MFSNSIELNLDASRCKHTTHARPLLSANTSLRSWSGTAFNQVLSRAGRSHGPLLTLLWEGLDALKRYVKTVWICVCAQVFDMIHVTRLSPSLSLMLTDQLICNINKENAQSINSRLVPSNPRAHEGEAVVFGMDGGNRIRPFISSRRLCCCKD